MMLIPSYTVSVRGKEENEPILPFLDEYYSRYSNNIESVFGFVEKSPLYGGRPFSTPELSANDINLLYQNNIGLRLPLTNLYITESIWQHNKQLEFLKKYHKECNTIITENNEFAKFVKLNFPKYQVERSVINELHSLNEIEKNLEIYDTIVLHAKWNTSPNLSKIPDKNKIRLFLNAGCGYNCPAKICYASFSRVNLGQTTETKCSFTKLERTKLGMVTFDEASLRDAGFSKFKVVRLISNDVVPPIF